MLKSLLALFCLRFPTFLCSFRRPFLPRHNELFGPRKDYLIMPYVIGVDLGGTKIYAVLTDLKGQILAQERLLTLTSQGPQAVIAQLITCIRKLQAALPAESTLLGVGVGSPGPLDPQTGVIFTSPNMPGWENIPLRDILQAQTDLPIVLGNDANVAALAERRFGGGKGYHNLIYLTVSTGIGSGIIADGRLLLGRHGMAGELGQMILDVGTRASWENLASGTALAKAAANAMLKNPDSLLHSLATPQSVTGAEVAQAAAKGDPLAQFLMQREAELLGLGLVNAIHIFSPEIVLVGGSVVTANPFLLERVRQVVQELAIADIYRTIPIELTQLGERGGALGAVALLLSELGL